MEGGIYRMEQGKQPKHGGRKLLQPIALFAHIQFSAPEMGCRSSAPSTTNMSMGSRDLWCLDLHTYIYTHISTYLLLLLSTSWHRYKHRRLGSPLLSLSCASRPDELDVPPCNLFIADLSACTYESHNVSFHFDLWRSVFSKVQSLQ